MTNEKTNTKKLEVALPIEWNIPENITTTYASNLVVQTTENIVKLFFFEIKPPLGLEEDYVPPKKIRADCVASVIITPDKLPKIIEVLQKQYDKYISKNKHDNLL